MLCVTRHGDGAELASQKTPAHGNVHVVKCKLFYFRTYTNQRPTGKAGIGRRYIQDYSIAQTSTNKISRRSYGENRKPNSFS